MKEEGAGKQRGSTRAVPHTSASAETQGHLVVGGGASPSKPDPNPPVGLDVRRCLFPILGCARVGPGLSEDQASLLDGNHAAPRVDAVLSEAAPTHLSPPPVPMALPDRAGAMMVANNSLTSSGGTAWPGW